MEIIVLRCEYDDYDNDFMEVWKQHPASWSRMAARILEVEPGITTDLAEMGVPLNAVSDAVLGWIIQHCANTDKPEYFTQVEDAISECWSVEVIEVQE